MNIIVILVICLAIILICSLIVFMLIKLIWFIGNGGIQSNSFQEMTFTTQLNTEEVIDRLKQHHTNDIFEYQFYEYENKGEFIFILNKINSQSPKAIGNIKYKVIIGYVENMSVIWFILLEGENKKTRIKYGMKINDFMRNKMRAIRVK